MKINYHILPLLGSVTIAIATLEAAPSVTKTKARTTAVQPEGEKDLASDEKALIAGKGVDISRTALAEPSGPQDAYRLIAMLSGRGVDIS